MGGGMRVGEGAMLFKDRNFNGFQFNAISAIGEYPDLGKIPAKYNYSKTFSSLKIAPGCTIKLYSAKNFAGSEVQLPHKVSDQEASFSNLHELKKLNYGHDMGDKVESLKVECDAKIVCENKPDAVWGDGNDCHSVCTPDQACNSKLGEYCSDRLFDEKCLNFCKNPDNNCDDFKIEQYCKTKSAQSGNVLQMCKCILTGPSNDLERKLDLHNGGQYEGTQQIRGGNYACWSPMCKDGTAPRADQLHLRKWWDNILNCSRVTICDVSVENSSIQVYDQSIFNIAGDCSGVDSAEALANSGLTHDNDNNDNNDINDKNDINDNNDNDYMKRKIIAFLFFIAFVALSGIYLYKTKNKH